MSYVTSQGLVAAIRTLVAYRAEGDRFLDTLFTVLLLKRLNVNTGASTPLTIEAFLDVCRQLLLVVRGGDPTSSYGEQLYNVFGSRKGSPLVQPDWPRSTIWTRYAAQKWNGILRAEKNNGSLSWQFVPTYVPILHTKLPRPIPVFALACVLFRRPSDVIGLNEFNNHAQLVEAFRLYFNLHPAEAALFDFSVPADVPPLGTTELSRASIVTIVADNEPSSPLGKRLAAAAGGTADVADQIVSCVREMGQALLFGPPGTGKSYWAVIAALRIAGFPENLKAAVDAGRVRVVVWHPSTTYEDFVRGVQVVGGTVTPRPGIFQVFCDKARLLETPHVLVIDEINRANPVAVLGDLLFALDMNKRGTSIQLSDGSLFDVPPNVYIIATANTADRSIAALDAALGRRFARVEIPPAPHLLGDSVVEAYRLADILARLNDGVLANFDREHRIGHSYFMDEEGKPLQSVDEVIFAFRYRIIPLLQDYCLDDFTVLERILGAGFIEVALQHVREGAFASAATFRDALAGIPGLQIVPPPVA